MEPDHLNRMAWQVAVLAMIPGSKGVELYSAGQVRFFFEQARSSRFETAIQKQMTQYNPQPSDGRSGRDERKIQTEMKNLRETNKAVGNGVIAAMKLLSPGERVRFTQYLLWNTKIIEQFRGNPDTIRNILLAEQVENPGEILDGLPKVVQYHDNRRERRR
ncbi:MAG: hypothetical protein LUQ07_04660 [Methanospirillum sp.]|nr:hypothetical protein [Methanospirillum sp.]